MESHESEFVFQFGGNLQWSITMESSWNKVVYRVQNKNAMAFTKKRGGVEKKMYL